MELIRKVSNVLKKIDAVLAVFQKWFAVSLILAMVVVGSVQVFGRYLFRYAPLWTEEFLRFFFIYLGFITISMASRADDHIAVDIIQEKIKNNKIRCVLFVITRLLCVLFLVIVTPWGIDLTRRMSRSVASSVPLSWGFIYVILPIGFSMAIIATLAHLADYAEMVWKGEK